MGIRIGKTPCSFVVVEQNCLGNTHWQLIYTLLQHINIMCFSWWLPICKLYTFYIQCVKQCDKVLRMCLKKITRIAWICLRNVNMNRGIFFVRNLFTVFCLANNLLLQNKSQSDIFTVIETDHVLNRIIIQIFNWNKTLYSCKVSSIKYRWH